MDTAAEIEFVTGDLTLERADAIVNPAAPGGLVDLAIRRAAGPMLLDELHWKLLERGERKLRPGRAIVTRGFGLAAPHVIHCGPPVYFDGPEIARAHLVSCHVEAVRLARACGFTSVSFPAIGTGVYRFPMGEAAELAVRAVIDEIRAHGGPRHIRFVLPDGAARDLYAAAGGDRSPAIRRAA
jgi:O-acetyl-ADP-ribose deacetylase (regulator of RNase III)